MHWLPKVFYILRSIGQFYFTDRFFNTKVQFTLNFFCAACVYYLNIFGDRKKKAKENELLISKKECQ